MPKKQGWTVVDGKGRLIFPAMKEFILSKRKARWFVCCEKGERVVPAVLTWEEE